METVRLPERLRTVWLVLRASQMSGPAVLRTASLIALMGYAIVVYFGYEDSLPNAKRVRAMIDREGSSKMRLGGRSCLVVLGGSNASLGLSAQVLSSRSCHSRNLGVSSEYGGFPRYLNWISAAGIAADTILYSSLDLWTDGKLVSLDREGRPMAWIPATPLVQQIWSLVTMPFWGERVPQNLDDFGDILGYSCANFAEPLRLDPQQFAQRTDFVVDAFRQRVRDLETTTGSRVVMLMVPLLYFSPSDSATMHALMATRVGKLKAQGISFIGAQWSSSDRTLFCDSFHLNDKGRARFSAQVRDALRNGHEPSGAPSPILTETGWHRERTHIDSAMNHPSRRFRD